MVEDFTELSAIEFKPGVSEVNKGNSCSKQNHVGVISVTTSVKWIVTDFISEGFIVQMSFFFKSVTTSIARKNVLMAKKSKLAIKVLTE